MYRTAFRNVWARKGHLLMTMLAVLLGTAFVAGTLIFSDSIEQSLEDSMSGTHSGISVQVTDTAADPSSGAANNGGARSPRARTRSGHAPRRTATPRMRRRCDGTRRRSS